MYEVLLSNKVTRYLNSLDVKSERICRNNLKKLKNPYPGKGQGDKEKITVLGQKGYRLHIGRTHTAFYNIDNDNKTVRVARLMTIEEAHKKYKY